jgi:hypothetical protein
VPRSQAAYDARAELILNRKKHEVRVEPYVRTPGLPDTQFRLGDVRLDCQVKIAIAKDEIPFWANAVINSLLLTTDWCSWFKGATPNGGDRSWSQKAAARLEGPPCATANAAGAEGGRQELPRADRRYQLEQRCDRRAGLCGRRQEPVAASCASCAG